MRDSLAAGRPVTLDHVASIADGLIPVRPGDLTFEHVRRFADDVVTVDDDAIKTAVLELFRRGKLVVEPSGAASVAALISGTVEPVVGNDTTTVVVLSGGNIGLDLLARLAGRADRPVVG